MALASVRRLCVECRAVNTSHRTELDRIMEERGMKNAELARPLKTVESTVSRWRSGVVPQQEGTRKAIVRAINRKEGFDPITAADLGWETVNV